MDDPQRLESLTGLILAPATLNLEQQAPEAPARPVNLRHFRWQQDRPCVAFREFSDRTAAEPFKGWALWMPEDQAILENGESFRHDWIGCEVFVGGIKVGEVTRLDPTPMGYDMIIMRDLRPGRAGLRDIPYIKEWFQSVDLPNRRIEVNPPEGLLDLDRMD
jgi:16S rRNA processing protein RimM